MKIKQYYWTISILLIVIIFSVTATAQILIPVSKKAKENSARFRQKNKTSLGKYFRQKSLDSLDVIFRQKDSANYANRIQTKRQNHRITESHDHITTLPHDHKKLSTFFTPKYLMLTLEKCNYLSTSM